MAAVIDVRPRLRDEQVHQPGVGSGMIGSSSPATMSVGILAAAGFRVPPHAGNQASIAVACASAIAGFAATSNVAAARRCGLATAGTLAHSFVEAFGDEERAFTAFAEDSPGKTTFLVDTYDTGRGVQAAIEVTRRLRLPRSNDYP
jgi:hypothetical protein